MSSTYHFGVPGYLVWTSHILIGFFLIYVGWILYEKKRMDKYTPILLIVVGVLAALYHAHIWFTELDGEKKKKH
jgi:hypothetical membrane protein